MNTRVTIIFLCHTIQRQAFYVFHLFISISQKRIFFYFSHLGNILFRTVNRNVGAGINTLNSISDGLGPSIFCRKMEKARPLREEMDGKIRYFPPESEFLPLMLYL